ncbi:hypothetical protein WT26_10065 [Burkholderia cepacia]|uniref:Uncharacterized protein n=2 Tax=Burkholderia cepacia complex TaxID=87882 RepID=A0A1B4PQX7_BURCE|nr:hypothetical protein WT26_10065 [Burkholderia cepacia]KVO42160.1 hypothetical protein WJ75_05415 [Burkholderia ubonensis]
MQVTLRRASITYAHSASRNPMSKTAWEERVSAAIGVVCAGVRACIPARYRKHADRRESGEHVTDSIAADSVQAAIVDAAEAEACAAELEKLEGRYAMSAIACFSSAHARIELLRFRVRKARLHAKRARVHADTAVLIFRSGIDGGLDATLQTLRHHADLAKQARLLAGELLDISLASEARETSRFSRCGRSRWPRPSRRPGWLRLAPPPTSRDAREPEAFD